MTLLCLELGLSVTALGATTQKDERLAKGAEPDSSYSFSGEPRPDLVLEIEVSRSALNKFQIYASLGVPEFWRFDLKRLRIYRLEGESYVEVPRSEFLPFDADSLTEQLVRAQDQPEGWLANLRDWVRASIPPPTS
jgi:Uma2 family endonuclease